MNIHELLNLDTAAATAPVAVSPTAGFYVVGLDSPQYRAEIDRQRMEGARFRRSGKTIDRDTEEGEALFQKRFDANQTAIAVAVTTGWYGFEDGGKPAKFSAETLRAMLAKKSTWRDKILAKVEDDAAFLPGAATASEPT